MAKFTSDVTNQVIVPQGEYEYSNIPIPTTMSKIRIRLKRINWPDLGSTRVIEVSVDLSLDGGNTWMNDWCGMKALGGNHVGRDGKVAEYSSVRRSIPEPENIQRKARVRVKANTQLTTQVVLECE